MTTQRTTGSRLATPTEEGSKINFPSFDIAAAMYHADQTALTIGYMYELRILTEVRRHLDYMYHNPDWAKKLLAPDGSRAIFDTRNTKACKRYRTKLTIS